MPYILFLYEISQQLISPRIAGNYFYKFMIYLRVVFICKVQSLCDKMEKLQSERQ